MFSAICDDQQISDDFEIRFTLRLGRGLLKKSVKTRYLSISTGNGPEHGFLTKRHGIYRMSESRYGHGFD